MSEGTGNPPPPPENPYGSESGQTPPPGGMPPPAGQQPPGQQPMGQAGYPSAPPPPPSSGPRPGELLDRFLARLIDFVILFIVNLVILVPVVIGMIGVNAGAGSFGFGGSFVAGAVTAVLSTVIYLGYFGFMESNQGRTVGKMVMKLHVEGAAGGKPTLEEAIKRNIWLGLPLLGIVPIIGGLIASLGQLAAVIMIAIGINNDPASRRPWTDHFAGTRVIKEG